MARDAEVQLRIVAKDDTRPGVEAAKRRLRQLERTFNVQERAAREQTRASRVQEATIRRQESSIRQQSRATREQERSAERAARREERQLQRGIRAQEAAEERLVRRREAAQDRALAREERQQRRLAIQEQRVRRQTVIEELRVLRAQQQFGRMAPVGSGRIAHAPSTAAAGAAASPENDGGMSIIAGAGARATGVVGAALGAGSLITAAADFESALTEIEKKSGATAEQMKAIREEALALATDGRVALPLSEIMDAYAGALAGGVPIDEVGNFVAQIARMSDAFEIDGKRASEAALRFGINLNVARDELEPFLDLINKLADSGVTSERNIVDFLDRAGAGMKNFGLDERTSAAIGASLLNMGLDPGVAGNMTSTFLTRLQAPELLSGDASAALEELVGPLERFKKALQADPSATLLDVFDRLSKLSTGDRSRILGEVGGLEWVAELQQAVQALPEIKRNLEIAGDEGSWLGSLSESYTKKLDDFWQQWEIFQNRLTEAQVTAGEIGLPDLMDGMHSLGEISDEVRRGLESFKVKVNTDELSAAQKALSEFGNQVTALMTMGGEDSAIEDFFSRLAASANVISGGIGAVRDVAEAVGLATPDKDTPEDRSNRLTRIWDGLREISPPLDWLSQSAGKPIGPIPKRAVTTPSPFSPPPQQIPSVISDIGAAYNREPPKMPQRGSGKTGRLNTFDEGRFGDPVGDGQEAIRIALEQGGAAVKQGGADAGAAIQDGTAQAAAAFAAAVVAALSSGGADVAASIRSALAAGVKVNMTGLSAGGSLSGRNTGRSMPNAGTTQSGAQGPHP